MVASRSSMLSNLQNSIKYHSDDVGVKANSLICSNSQINETLKQYKVKKNKFK